MEILHADLVLRHRKSALTDQRQTRKSTIDMTHHALLTTKFRRGKTDLVLEGVLRIERFLHEFTSSLVSLPGPTAHQNTTDGYQNPAKLLDNTTHNQVSAYITW
jgi:hypothetical protein